MCRRRRPRASGGEAKEGQAKVTAGAAPPQRSRSTPEVARPRRELPRPSRLGVQDIVRCRGQCWPVDVSRVRTGHRVKCGGHGTLPTVSAARSLGHTGVTGAGLRETASQGRGAVGVWTRYVWDSRVCAPVGQRCGPALLIGVVVVC